MENNDEVDDLKVLLPWEMITSCRKNMKDDILLEVGFGRVYVKVDPKFIFVI